MDRSELLTTAKRVQQCMVKRFKIALLYANDTASRQLHGWRWIGHIIHTIQDSYARRHCKREGGKIRKFYNFAEQSTADHIAGDIANAVLDEEWLELYRAFYSKMNPAGAGARQVAAYSKFSGWYESLYRVEPAEAVEAQQLFVESVWQCHKVLSIYLDFRKTKSTLADLEAYDEQFAISRFKTLVKEVICV